MANLFLIFSILCFFAFGYILKFHPISNDLIQMSVVYILGVMTGAFVLYKSFLTGEKYLKNVKNRLEKTSNTKDEQQLKIRTLENKIKTLEAALDKMIKK